MRQYLTLTAILLACPTRVVAQAIDTVRARVVFDAVTAQFAEYEKAHGRFAEVNGIRMHYLEWGKADGIPLVWAPGRPAPPTRSAPSLHGSRPPDTG